MRQILIFTDLDGTLLDHHSYSYQAALPALGQIRSMAIPLILNSSKTMAEIRGLRTELDNRHPFVVENGGAVCVPRGYFQNAPPFGSTGEEPFEIEHFGIDYRRLLGTVHAIRQEGGFAFKGFADLSAAEVAWETGLPVERAELARARLCSEPLKWLDSESALPVFEAALHKKGLRLLRGGRFFHVMGRFDKAQALRWLIEGYRKVLPGVEVLSIALGDSPNDRAMLEEVDIPVVIPPARGEPLRIDNPHTVYAGAQGPAGWQSAMAELLTRLNTKGC